MKKYTTTNDDAISTIRYIDADKAIEDAESEYRWDRAHASDCGWDDRDLAAIAEGMTEFKRCIDKQLILNRDKKYREITYSHWDFSNDPAEPWTSIATCAHCNRGVRDMIPVYPICPFCGSQMLENAREVLEIKKEG